MDPHRKGAYLTPSPFYTFDPFEGDLVRPLVDALDNSSQGDDEKLRGFIEDEPRISERLNKQGVKSFTKRSDIKWDDATLVFVLLTPEGEKGETLQRPFDKSIVRERLGRFPWYEGNVIEYLLKFLITPEDEQGLRLSKLLMQLCQYFDENHQGHERFEKGLGGLKLLGYLTADDALQLAEDFRKTRWKISASEPFDGGVVQIVKNLQTILRAAKNRDLGIVMREHS